jgi:tetratricopeptide (TPR) repeat protein
MPTRTPDLLFESGKKQLAENHRKYARSLFRKALKEGKKSLDTAMRAELLRSLAKVDRDLGFVEDARVHYAMAAEIIRTLNNPLALAHTLRHEADILREQKKISEAETIYGEALRLYRTHPEHRPLDLANALRGYALLKASAATRAPPPSFGRRPARSTRRSGSRRG